LLDLTKHLKGLRRISQLQEDSMGRRRISVKKKLLGANVESTNQGPVLPEAPGGLRPHTVKFALERDVLVQRLVVVREQVQAKRQASPPGVQDVREHLPPLKQGADTAWR